MKLLKRWKGGLVYVDLIYDNHIVPFVIGSASFAPINGLHRLHGFSKLSKFVDWISKIMREEGADVSFEPLICAKRHLEYRRQNNNTKLFEPNIAVDTTVSIHSHPDAPHTKICAGVLIRKDAVITLAQCASNLIVVLADGSFIAIRDIIIHPDYSDDSLYNNKFFAVHGLNVRFSYECNPSEEHHSRLLKGLHPEHMCLQNNHTLVPGSCEAHPGSAVFWYHNDKKYLLGLYMHGENCGFGDQALGLYVYAYNAWVHSVLDTPLQKSLGYVFPFLKTSDECSYPDGATGTCVSHINCPNISKRAGKSLPIFYCSSRAIVCCPRHLEAQKEEEHEGIAFAFYRTV
uniref:Peptidase S1 domain-containing protein n=1 Tax=Anopheles arabiensis TaxID=7173 RepID=A0A182HZD4_ANOAR